MFDEDSDVIAYIYPHEGKGRKWAKNAINLPQNSSMRKDPEKPPLTSLSRCVRGVTEEPEEVNDLDRLPCVVLRFSNPPKTRLGLVAGRCPQADLVLPDVKGVSYYHFSLTFDGEKYLVVKDLDSTAGTQVIYDNEKGESGRGVTWSACGPSLAKGKPPVIKVIDELQFRLVVPNHDTSSKTYLDNVARFLEGAVPAESLFSDINLTDRPKTELPTPSKAHTPLTQKPGGAFWKKELGRGTGGVVNYVWDVSTRAEYALKEPHADKKIKKED